MLIKTLVPPGGFSGLGGQYVAPASEGEADGCDQRHFRDEVPQSEKVGLDYVVIASSKNAACM